MELSDSGKRLILVGLFQPWKIAGAGRRRRAPTQGVVLPGAAIERRGRGHRRTLRHPEVLNRPTSLEGVLTFDLATHGRE
jgi:hypothetical protein